MALLPYECYNTKQEHKSNDCKLAVGYNTNCTQVLDMMEWVGEGYNFMNKKSTDPELIEEPGITCFDICKTDDD